MDTATSAHLSCKVSLFPSPRQTGRRCDTVLKTDCRRIGTDHGDGGCLTTDHIYPRLAASMTAEQAAPGVLTAGAREFGLSLAQLLASDDPDGPHKSRVALRRLRAALIAFKPIIGPDLLAALTARLKGYFKVIGQVRDADVLAHDVAGAGNQDQLQAEADRVRRKVRKRLLHQRADRVAAFVEKRFGGKDWQRRTSTAKALSHAPVTGLAAAALDRNWSKCLSHGLNLVSLTAPERHELRKALKTFRYLCEYFSGLWPGDQAQAFLAALRNLQEDLGSLNDLAMARARGLSVGDASEGPTLHRAAAAWARLAACGRWWG